jgi:hypothetical protein
MSGSRREGELYDKDSFAATIDADFLAMVLRWSKS